MSNSHQIFQQISAQHQLEQDIKSFKNDQFQTGALLVTELDTSKNWQQWALHLAQQLGTPYAEDHEKNTLVQKIQPKKSDANKQTSSSYQTELLAHIENVGQEHIPDYLVIVCANNTEQAMTTIMSPILAIQTMLKHDQANLVTVLQTPQFWVRAPESFTDGFQSTNHQIITGGLDTPIFHADFADVGGNTPVAKQAYKAFKQACEANMQTVILKPGQALLLRNFTSLENYKTQAMHGRKAFFPNFDNPRTLYRVYVSE